MNTAEKVYLHFRENDPETGRRRKMLGDGNPDAQIVYVIPEISKEEELAQEALKSGEVYNPCKD